MVSVKPSHQVDKEARFLNWQDAMKNLPAKLSKAAFNPGLHRVGRLTPGALQEIIAIG